MPAAIANRNVLSLSDYNRNQNRKETDVITGDFEW